MELRYVDEVHFKRRVDKFGKNHPAELIQVVNNLKNALSYWEERSVEELRRSGLVHREAGGAVAVDQRGCKPKSNYEMRLYFYPQELEDGTKICWRLTIGDKNTQRLDNVWCKQEIEKLLIS